MLTARATTLSITLRGVSAEFVVGTNLFQANLEAGGKFASKSCGEAKCGAGPVFVTVGRKGQSKMTPLESAKLDSLIGVGSKSRLACQASLLGTEMMTVEMLGTLSG